MKLIFRFLDQQLIEPSTKQPYGAILKDLKSVKAFASGILVPKTYIWPVDKDHYLQPATTLVKDAHGLDLEVYAFKFANDFISSYNYSYVLSTCSLLIVLTSLLMVSSLTSHPQLLQPLVRTTAC